MTIEEIRSNFIITVMRCGKSPNPVQFEVLFREKRALAPAWRLHEVYAQSITLRVQLSESGSFEISQGTTHGMIGDQNAFKAAAIEAIQQAGEPGKGWGGGWT